MNTILFRYVLEVDKTRSISQAAENLYMAQPNLSKAIKELEESFHITIFSRNSKGVEPTKEGMEFLRYAKNLVHQMDQMEALGEGRHTGHQKFRISIPRGTYISDSAINLIKGLNVNNPLEISLKETNSMNVADDILSNVSELGIVRYQVAYQTYFWDYFQEKGLDHHLVWEFEYLLLMSDAHPLAKKDIITLADLTDYIEIAHADIEVPFIRRKQHSEKVNGDKKIYVYERYSQFELLSQMDNTYIWASPVPEAVLEKYHLVQRKCQDKNVKGNDEIVYLEDFRISDLYERFIDKLYESRNRLAYGRYR